jgi:hypothetical protein
VALGSEWNTRNLSTLHVWRSLAVILAALAVAPMCAHGQSVSGAIAVSATVLPPDRARAPHLISFSVARTGIARFETAAPIAGVVSQIVMVTLSSPTNSFAPAVQAPTLVLATRDGNRVGAATTPSDASPVRRMCYEMDVGRPPVGSNVRAMSVRISYLIVPGGT